MTMRTGFMVFVVMVGLFATSCTHVWRGVDAQTGELLTVEPTGTMPSGESFTGQFVSAQLGQLDLEQTGEQVTGHFERLRPPDDDCRIVGQLEGAADGDLVEFTWTEDYTDCGDAVASGEGYLILRAEAAVGARLYGERGLGCDDTGKDVIQAFAP